VVEEKLVGGNLETIEELSPWRAGAEDCWGAPDPEENNWIAPGPDTPPSRLEEVIKVARQLTLENKPGDDRLGRQLTLDEYIRRGGNYATWPGLIENIEGVE